MSVTSWTVISFTKAYPPFGLHTEQDTPPLRHQTARPRTRDLLIPRYGAWPDRLYLVGKDGKIAMAGGRGPFDFKPDKLEKAIQKELEKIKTARP